MREIRTSGLMSGERKRSDAHRAQATAPLLDSTPTRIFGFWSELGIYMLFYFAYFTGNFPTLRIFTSFGQSPTDC